MLAIPLLFVIVVILSPVNLLKSCSSCHKVEEGKLNVHLIPHSHDDVGWVKTVDEYYYGAQPYIGAENTAVQAIINSVLGALEKNSDRRFSQVETAFFWKWWQDQNTSEASKKIIVDLVNSGQLEIVNGAWTMNDEASTNYQQIIDQFTWGFRVLNETLGECATPKIGWQIDPFGHSREHASIIKQLGFDGLVLGRITSEDKRKRMEEQNLEFLWKTSANLQGDVDIFTTMFPDLYLSEPGFTFDLNYPSTTIIDDENSPFYNLDYITSKFVNVIENYTTFYRTSNLILPMGGDFTFQAAEINFSNLDRLIRAFKDDARYNVFYSTPSCYVAAVKDEIAEKQIVLTEKTDDFFPYASEEYVYWTGFYSSRQNLKRNERVGNKILQISKQLTTFSNTSSDNALREIIGVLQHHDAITGTEKQYVSEDYMRLLFKAEKSSENVVSEILNVLLRKNNEGGLELTTCPLANVSICEISSKEKFIVAVYNPLSRSVNHYVRLPVNHTSYRIRGVDGDEIFDVFQTASDFSWVKEKQALNYFEIVFKAKSIPPLGVKVYYVEKIDDAITTLPNVTETYFGTKTNGFTVSDGQLTSITLNGKKVEATQNLLNYHPAGVQLEFDRISGAYVFNPQSIPESFLKTPEIKAVRGQLVDEVIFNYNTYTNQTIQAIRAYKGEDDNFIEFEWIVGDLPYVGYGNEVVNRFNITGFNCSGTFYTDSNGREIIKRERNKRYDYDYDSALKPVTSNYYPITSRIILKDVNQNLEVAILNDRPQGGSSLSDNSVELMIYRRLFFDESLGVMEPLNEIEYGKGVYVKGRHYFVMNDIASAAEIEKDFAQRISSEPWILVGDATQFSSFENFQNLFNLEFAGLARDLPKNVKILTLEPWKDQLYLLRLEHLFEKGEDSVLSAPVTVDLENLFTMFDVSDIEETTLGANIFLEDSKPTLQITLNPMEIRTFLIKINLR